MAVMTVVYTVEAAWRIRNKRFRRVLATVDAGNYAAGGIALVPANCNLTQVIDSCTPEGSPIGMVGWYDRANGMLEIWYCDYDAVADGALIEHAAAAMTAGALYFLVIGW